MQIKFKYKGYTAIYLTDIESYSGWQCRIANRTVRFKTPEFIMRSIDSYNKAIKLLGKEIYTLVSDDKGNREIIKTTIARVTVEDESVGWDGTTITDANGRNLCSYYVYVEKKDLKLLERELEIDKMKKKWLDESNKNATKLFNANVYRKVE